MKRSPLILFLTLFIIVLSFMFISRRSAASGPEHLNNATAVNPLANPQSSSMPQQESKIQPQALRQIKALLEEKELRTPAQQKIDSQLLYASKMRRGEKLASNVDKLSVDVDANDAGLVTVDITAIIDDQLLSRLRGMNIDVSNVFPRYNSLRCIVSLEQLETIARFSQVRFIQPKQQATLYQAKSRAEVSERTEARSSAQSWERPYQNLNNRTERVGEVIQSAITAASAPGNPLQIGSVTSQGDVTHAAFIARGTFNTDGSGIKIGVLSDGVFGLGMSQRTGDLGSVTVLSGQSGSGAEGTAMLEIIHDLAPGAQLFFATGINGVASFAQNIRNLRAAGCDIIVDDIGYPVESPFQDGQTPAVVSTLNGGLVTQAVNDVVASGALRSFHD